jgi:hypothetical protein
MLETMRQKGASIFIYLIFGVLIAVFVINFGPSGNQGGGGCGTQSNTVVEVEDSGANLSAYRIAYSNHFNRMRSRDRVYFALETLIRRELLAQAAEARGMRVTGEMVDDEIKKGSFFIGGLRVPLGQNIFDIHDDGTRTWNVRKFKNWVAGLDVRSTSTYRDEQVRSLQAAMMYELLSSGPRVSREEAMNDFLYSKNTVSYDIVAFTAAPYRAAMRLTDADVDRYLAAHEADVKARYQQDERLYKGLKPQLKLRQIFIAKQEAPKPAEQPAPAGSGSAAGSGAAGSGSAVAAGSGAGSGSAVAKAPKKEEPKKEEPKKIGMPIDEAKKQLQAARDAITAGKEKFADAAKRLATDDAAKASGGDVGWRGVENPQLGDKAVNDAVKALKPGEMTQPIETPTGVVLVLAEDKREGDLDYEKVKKEIATELAKDGYAKEAAKRDALKAIDEARAGTGKNLYDMFKKEEAPGGNMPNLDFLNDPNLTDEQKQMLIEQLKQSMPQGGGPTGTLVWESKDVPVKWQEDGSAGSAAPAGGGSAKPAGSAAGSAKPAGSAAGSAKPDAGSAKPATGSGSAAGSAAGSAGSGSGPDGIKLGEAPKQVENPIAIPPVEASKETLPQFGEVEKPKIQSFGPEPRKATLPGLNKDLTTVVFDELSAGMLAKRVYEVDGGFVLVQIANKGQAKVEDFEKDAERYISRLQLVRGWAAAEEWIQERCKALSKDKLIVPMKELVSETDDKGNAAPQVYQPCMFQGFTGMKQDEWLTLMLPALGIGG